MKYTYEKEKNKKGEIISYRCWTEGFKDNDTGEIINIERRKAIKIDGKKIVQKPAKLLNPAPVKCFAAERKEDGLILLDSFHLKKSGVHEYMRDLKIKHKWKGTF